MTKVKLADGRLELCQLSRLLQLIRERKFEAIATHIADGVPTIVDYVHPEDYGETSLGLAASINDDNMIRHLLTLGAETDVYDLKGRSAAMRAAEMGHVQSMLVLAENGIDMRLVDESGQGRDRMTSIRNCTRLPIYGRMINVVSESGVGGTGWRRNS